MKIDLGHWIYGGSEININDYIGFIYKITNNVNNKKYIGKKLVIFRVTKKPLKGRVNKRRKMRESDWKTYMGSCEALQEDIKKLGHDNFSFEILYWCKTKMELSYMEIKYIVDNNAIFDKNYYNQYFGCRFRNRK
jgi:hypothetical protein